MQAMNPSVVTIVLTDKVERTRAERGELAAERILDAILRRYGMTALLAVCDELSMRARRDATLH
jgi:hypothetical protein